MHTEVLALLAAALLALATASAGAYYAFFACALYAVSGLYGWVIHRTWRAVASAGLGSLEEQEKRIFAAHADAPPCNECGEIMIRNGSCYACINCGATSGCS